MGLSGLMRFVDFGEKSPVTSGVKKTRKERERNNNQYYSFALPLPYIYIYI